MTTAPKSPIVIKVGGAVRHIAGALSALPSIVSGNDHAEGVILVHGGGSEISRWMEAAGLRVTFKNGLRVTDERALEVAIMVLRGLVNTQLVSALRAIGVRAVGLSG